jgi:hypothetical protein
VKEVRATTDGDDGDDDGDDQPTTMATRTRARTLEEMVGC